VVILENAGAANGHAIEERFFLPDGGGGRCGFQAQTLAAQGFLVLRMPVIYANGEMDKNRARLDAAIEALRVRRAIDLERIGIVGFSITGYVALYLITHPGAVKIAAAAGLDGSTGGFTGYLRDLAL